MYLNTERPLENYKNLFNSKYFVDKSLILNDINELINTSEKFLCITRPRRFGKTSIADMLSSYYCKAFDSSSIFNSLNIKDSEGYEENLNKHNVISISFSEITDYVHTYKEYMDNIINTLKEEIITEFNIKNVDTTYSLKKILRMSGEKFIFIIDEWDYIFNNHLFEENQNDFLEFLRNIFKDEAYISLCYMTGILPIKKYSTGSALNMFDEYTMLSDTLFNEYFGFTESEVKVLCNKQNKIKFDELREWYNGYINEGVKLYNPRSVVKALKNRKCKNYWTSTGAMNEVLKYLKYNILDVKNDVIKMVAGEEIKIKINEEFRAGQTPPKTRKEIYSAMIVLGFLSYNNGYLKIPNEELMMEFEKALEDNSFGEVSKLIACSDKILEATLKSDAKTVESILHKFHNSELSIFKYNDENSLACVVTLAYLTARDTYRIEREEKTGKGFADFMFHPKTIGDTAFVVELKKDDSVETAINQIKEKEYAQKFKAENQCGKILAVAICYDSKTKEHHCKIEELS